MYNAVIKAAIFSFALCSNFSHALILSGQIKASDNQTFYAPKTDSWNVQIKWLLPEGDIAQEGDLVAVFDSGSLESQLEQEQVSLIAAEEELQRLISSAKQKLLETNYGQKRTELLLAKARIDAAIALEHLSEYDYQKNQLEFEKAVIANAKAKEELGQTKLANRVSIEKQKITIKTHQDKLKFNQYKLKQMSVYAKRSGPILYASHPWNGEKVFVGMTAQASWQIAEIPSMNGLYIEAWVHEVDFKNLIQDQKVPLKFDAFPDVLLTAQLSNISTQPEERKEWGSGVYYRAVFDFANHAKVMLLPGMSAQLELKGTSDE
jgi:multidrug efflux pump subunit AcrA (membrane-fusion protein)